MKMAPARYPARMRLVGILALTLALLAGCDEDLQTVTQALLATSRSVGLFQETIISLDKLGSLDRDTSRALMEASIQVSRAGNEAVGIASSLEKLQVEDRTRLSSILVPLIQQLASIDTNIVAAIADPRTQNQVRVSLALIQTGLNTAQLALALQ